MRGRLDVFTSLPLIDLALNGTSVTLLIDTGFTGPIAIGLDCAERIGINLGEEREVSKTAGGDAVFSRSKSRVSWFDSERHTNILVWESRTLGPVDGVMGVAFLIGYILVVDLNEGDVLIKNPTLLSTLDEP